MRSTNLLEHVYLCLRKYAMVWIIPTIAFFTLAVLYNKFLATKTYTARQSLILRDDLMGDAFKPSRFESQESLKSAQETVLEIARKPQIVREVLEELGPTSSFSFGEYPSVETIEEVQGNITLAAPNGAEFGKTEAVVLSVKTIGPERSKKFVNLLLDKIDSKLNDVRLLRLNSMQNELSQATHNASMSLKDASRELQDLEMSFGAEISTIRGLNDPQGSGGFDLKLNQIRLEQRQAAANLTSARQQRELLRKAKENRDAEFVTSNELLQLQPALQGMMTNLSTVMAQLALDEGRYTEFHPALQRSRRAVKRQKEQLFDSIGATIKGLDSQIETLSSLEGDLSQSVADLEGQLKNLSEQRVPYATLEESVKKKAEIYNEVQGRLAKVQSYAASTEQVAMLTRVDDPQVSSRPDQIGAFNAGLVGGGLGLMCGLGLVALLAPPFVDPRTYQPSAETHFSNVPPTDSQVQPTQSFSTTSSATNQQVPTETASESRLRSVTALQRSASRPDPEPSVSAGANSLMSNELDSVIPDSVAQHMAAIKEGKSGASTQTAGTLKAEATPPVNVPVVPSSDSSESIAKQIEVSKRETAKSDKPSSADVIAAYKNKNAKADSKAKSDAQVAAAKIAAASTATTDPRQAGEKKGTAERRPTVSSFANAGSGVPATAKADSKTLRATEKTHESPDIIIVDRVRSPEVPESITNGRITAESLLKSAEDKKEVETASTPSTPTQEQVTAKVPEGGIENPMNQNIESDSRIPSITDYAKSLDRKLGSVGGQRIALSSDELQPDDADDASSQRRSNVRPVDIAKSVEDPSLMREAKREVLPSDTSSEATQIKKPRDESISDFVGSMDGSVAGLMRQAKSSSLFLDASSEASSVAPAEQDAPAPATPEPRQEVDSSAIPSQIRKLSDSFSSFARPTKSEEEES